MTPSPNHQETRLRKTRIRTYQTYLIFRDSRLAQLGLKWLTFLGIIVPLAAGGIVLALYSDAKPPFALVAGAGLVGLLQTIVSVWALVFDWEHKAQLSARTAEDFRQLHIELETFRPDGTGNYDESRLSDYERRSWGGLTPDDVLQVSRRERDRTRAIAERRYQ